MNPSRTGHKRTFDLQLEVVILGSAAGHQPPRSGADLRVAVAVGADAEDAQEIVGVGEESFHLLALARARRHHTGLRRHLQEP